MTRWHAGCLKDMSDGYKGGEEHCIASAIWRLNWLDFLDRNHPSRAGQSLGAHRDVAEVVPQPDERQVDVPLLLEVVRKLRDRGLQVPGKVGAVGAGGVAVALKPGRPVLLLAIRRPLPFLAIPPLPGLTMESGTVSAQ